MVAAENFVNELDAKNQPSIQRVIAALNDGLGKEGVEVADALRMALKAAMSWPRSQRCGSPTAATSR